LPLLATRTWCGKPHRRRSVVLSRICLQLSHSSTSHEIPRSRCSAARERAFIARGNASHVPALA
jgi:hypothetical protein